MMFRHARLMMLSIVAAIGLLISCGVAGTAAAADIKDIDATSLIRAGNESRGGEKAQTVLDSLLVKGRAPKTGYSRAEFGPAWADVDHNGCDTRNDILARDLTDVKYKLGTKGCVVKSGKLDDPYTGKKISFKRGNKTSAKVQIDHVVALSDAWQKGAQQLTADERKELANDPYNLLAVQGKANQQKSDGDAATWLPANKKFRCEYVARQIGVKAKYSLWVTKAERKAMTKVLNGCPAQLVPTMGGVIGDGGEGVSDTADKASDSRANNGDTSQSGAQQQDSSGESTAQPETPAQIPDENVYYPNCTAVRAAGKAPLYQGQPGYNTKLDRDRDGVACE